MKIKLLAGVVGAALLAAGCVSTADGHKTAGVPLIKDKFISLYKVAPDTVFAAAKSVMAEDGVLTNEGTNYGTNGPVKFVQGKVNESKVWISVAVVDKNLTQVTVQVRRGGGGSDLVLANQLDKEIAVKMARQPAP